MRGLRRRHGRSRGGARIARITGATITRADTGHTIVSVAWVDSRGRTGATGGTMPSAHLDALLARAKREGVPIARENW